MHFNILDLYALCILYEVLCRKFVRKYGNHGDIRGVDTKI